DRDWITFLVQPFLTSDIVASGGPNVVPPDDPPMAQCIARAPGGPTHVLLDDRIAEHVPGCNMAFRREALLAIGGFNPIYLRAGVHPFAFLPHSIRWQVLSFVLAVGGVLVAAMVDHKWAAALLLGAGLVGIVVTIAKNIQYALRSEVGSLPGSMLWYRAVVA